MVDHTEKAKAIVQSMAAGSTEKEALKKAGFSAMSATKGLSSTFASSPRLGEAVKREIDRWLAGGSCVPKAEERVQLVRQRLLMNILEGKDKAVQSAKLLGQDREVNMFEPENRVGIAVNVAPPSEWAARYAPEPEEEQGK